MTILDSDTALKDALAALTLLDPVMGRLVAEGPAPALRRRPAGFEGLAWIVTGQQVSTASALAIWGRVREHFPLLTPQAVLAASEEALRAPGLSGPKVRTLQAAAAAVACGDLPLDALSALPADEAHRLLVAVKGIGPWTADVYLLFCLGHADAFPAGDIALQEAARAAYGLDARPTRDALAAMAEAWRPWRGAAATALWAHYRRIKGREGVAAGEMPLIPAQAGIQVKG